MSFSPDEKNLVTQSGAPDWILSIWNWEKAKLIASIKSTSSVQPISHVLPLHQSPTSSYIDVLVFLCPVEIGERLCDGPSSF